jgi:adenylate cyclase
VTRLEAQLEELQTSFNRFVPHSLVDRIITSGGDIPPERKEVTVLFADIVGFTTLSERHDPAIIVEILNRYFEAMTSAISKHQGLVSKFIGDGIMATFGALSDNPWQFRDSVEAALSMREALVQFNSKSQHEQLPPLEIGIGVHHGTVIAGFVGSSKVREFTVIGDTVNVAARVESLTRAHDTDILVTEPIYRQIQDSFPFVEMPLAEVKGKREAIRTWRISE